MKRFLMIQFSIILLLLSAVQIFAVGGDLDTTFNTGVAGFSSTVNAVAVQADGRVLIGGNFTVVNGRSSNLLARLNTDGTIDQSFNIGTGFNNSVSAIAVQADGRILVGGNFNSFNGTSRSFLLRLNADGSFDPSFNVGGTGPNAPVDVITIQPNGQILIGGFITQFNGTTVGRLARLNTDGSLDTGFNTNLGTGFDSLPSTIAVEPDGQIVVGGRFNNLGGATANRIARLNADGTRDTAFITNNGTGVSGGAFGILAVAVQTDGRILIGGQISTFNGTTRNHLARLNADGSLDTNWTNITANGGIQNIEIQPDGQFYILGENGISFGSGANNRRSIARLNASDGSIDPSFNLPNGVNGVTFRAITLQLDGTIFIGGNFTNAGNITRSGIANLNADGSVNANFSTVVGSPANVESMVVLPDDRILIGGNFAGVNESFRSRIARLNPDGTTDLTFNPGVGGSGGSSVFAIAVQTDGRILVGGSFSSFGGVNGFGIARLNPDGTRDTTFNASTNGTVNAIVVQSDGRIVIAGNFNFINGASGFNRIARLNANGTADTTFNIGTGFSSNTEALILQPDGQIIVGGIFNAYNGATTNRIARLNGDGTLDTVFTANNGTGFNSSVDSLALQTDGRILAGGFFGTFNGASSNQIARLNADGSRDTTFNVGTGFSNSVNDFALQPDGRIVCVGNFATFNSVTRRNLARLNTDGSLDASFRSGAALNNNLEAVGLQTDGRIIIGGALQNYDGVPRFGIARVSAGETLVWTGAINSDWNNGGNWSGGIVPTSADNAVIPNNFNINFSGNFSVLTLTVGTNSILTIAAGSSLSIEGGTNNGTVSGAGTLNFIGVSFGNNGIISVSAFNVNVGTGGNKALTGNGAFVGNLLTLAPNVNLALQNNQEFNEINLQSGAIFDATSRSVTLRGTNPLQGTGTIINGFGTIIFEGDTAQTISRPVNFNNLTINNPNGVNFSGSGFYFVQGTLDLNNGILDLGTNTLLFDNDANTARTNGYVTGRIVKRFFVSGVPAFTFPLGTANGYSPVSIQITTGTTEVSARVFETNQPNLDPATSLRRFWTLSANNNGNFTGNLIFNYLQTDVFGDENQYRITRIFSGVPTSFANNCASGSPCVDPATNTATINNISEFSDWTLSEVAPSASAVDLGGKVQTTNGRGIGKAFLTLTNQQGEIRTATTNQFGFYRFREVAAGGTYVISVAHKQFQFKPSSQVISAAEDKKDINFTGVN